MVDENQVKSILNKHKKRDDWFLDDYSINPSQKYQDHLDDTAKKFFLKYGIKYRII